MTLSSIFHKLRKTNHGQYKQFWGCLMFANVLVSSFMAVLFSGLIQSTLPDGGDSRKQIYLIFGVAVVGCFIFVLYAMGLFLRHKSKEIGLFLALGTDKSKLTKALLGEIIRIACSAILVGILAGNLVALVIGKIFEAIAVNAEKIPFKLSFGGIIPAVAFALIVLICLLIMGVFFMKRSNIIEIINEQRKSEPIKKEVSERYLVTGIVMFAAGIFLAAILPGLSASIFKQYLSSLFNGFYLLCVLGMYRCKWQVKVQHFWPRKVQYSPFIFPGMFSYAPNGSFYHPFGLHHNDASGGLTPPLPFPYLQTAPANLRSLCLRSG